MIEEPVLDPRSTCVEPGGGKITGSDVENTTDEAGLLVMREVMMGAVLIVCVVMIDTDEDED